MADALVWKIWLAIIWLCMLLEGVWFFTAGSFMLTHPALSYCLLLMLWLIVLIGLVRFTRRPNFLVVGSLANLIGCVSITAIAGGLPNPIWRLLYDHSLDIVIFVSSYMALRSYQKEHSIPSWVTNI
jgi:hypothetical protein